jgi:hypothetical protein
MLENKNNNLKKSQFIYQKMKKKLPKKNHWFEK